MPKNLNEAEQRVDLKKFSEEEVGLEPFLRAWHALPAPYKTWFKNNPCRRISGMRPEEAYDRVCIATSRGALPRNLYREAFALDVKQIDGQQLQWTVTLRRIASQPETRDYIKSLQTGETPSWQDKQHEYRAKAQLIFEKRLEAATQKEIPSKDDIELAKWIADREWAKVPETALVEHRVAEESVNRFEQAAQRIANAFSARLPAPKDDTTIDAEVSVVGDDE